MCILYIIQCWHQKVSRNLEKKLIKVSQKKGKIIYLYKSVDIYFLLHLRFYQNFKTYHAGKLNKTDLVNIRFAHQGLFPETQVFIFTLMCKLDGTFTFIHLEKYFLPCFGVSMKYLVVWILWPELRIYLQGIWFFDKFENTLRW